jgi:hypothetical protein
MAPDEVGQNTDVTSKNLHEHTYGIATDAITQFAVVFSALIHDVGHTGVGNERMVTENPELAKHYANKSIAEQRSIDIAWELLLLPRFDNLRSCIYQNKEECARFHHLVVNSVMATDIFDKDLKAIRNHRWDLSFHPETVPSDAKEGLNEADDIHRKATIVIEHIIQASDVSHTMQHWYVYKKWNERLFQEIYLNYVCGRADKDPSLGWYNGELWFFDNYVIPLAKKLEECGVFGVSSDEYLIYAKQNRREWEQKGHEVIRQFRDSASALAAKMGWSSPDGTESLTQNSATSAETDDFSDEKGSVSTTSKKKNRNFVLSDDIRKVVEVPPGRLGVIIDATVDGPVIHEISPSSPFYGQVQEGDRLLTLDDISCTSLNQEAFAALMEAKMDQPRRFLFANSSDR